MNTLGKTSDAKKTFLLESQSDKDYLDFKERAIYSKTETFGTINVNNDIYCEGGKFNKIVKKFLNS